MNPPDGLREAAASIAPIPRDSDDAPVFRAPWEAQAFAMTLVLHQRGLFTWSEWADALGREIHAAAEDDGSRYYEHWLTAIEWLTAEKGIADPALLDEHRAAWNRAARATPHGEPIFLDNDPLARAG